VDPQNRTSRDREQNIDDVVVLEPANSKHTAMDKDQINYSAEQAKGVVKETAGKLVGDKKLETEGTTDKAAGKAQSGVGGLKNAVRGNKASTIIGDFPWK
jgi:uncharacterized protein YjbJ (UPF0337 family)